MTAPRKHKPDAISLLIENPDGVTEYIVGLLTVNEIPVFGPLAARVASGEGSSLSLERLKEAVALHHWAERNVAVFRDGRVVYES